MKRGLYILIVLLVILLLAVGGCRKAGTWLVKKDDVKHADVIVMLTGSLGDRILQTADLYQQGVAGKIWIVEPGSGADSILEARGVQLANYISEARNAFNTLGIPADSIVILPGAATSTRMEAEAVRDYLLGQNHLLTRNNIDTLLLVSSSGHTRRAYKLFKAAIGPISSEETHILCSPSIYTNFNAEKWWRTRDDIQNVVFEYMKMLNFTLFEKRELRKSI